MPSTLRDPDDVGDGVHGGVVEGGTGGLPAEVDQRLHGWRHPAVLTAAGLSVAAGFAQFSATAALPDVADGFGLAVSAGDELGLSATTLGLGLAVIRLASLGALPLSGLADRMGRRRVVLGCAAMGLALTAVAAASPSFWVFVALLALGRPALSAVNALAGVLAAEETRSRDRAWAIALVTAGYGTGAGLTALLRGVFGPALGFRWLFALAAVPLLVLPLLARKLEEPARFVRLRARVRRKVRLVRVRGWVRSRLVVVAGLTFAISFLTGPVNTNLFLYAETVLGMARSTTAVVVLAAAPLGTIGLLLGRAAADRLGRVRTAAVTHALLALMGVVIYSGDPSAVVAGYLATIVVGSAYAPSYGAIATELFPTSVRATAAGVLTVAGVLGAVAGLLLFGVLVDVFAGNFGAAALVVATPVLAATLLFTRLPETRSMELEESAPEIARVR